MNFFQYFFFLSSGKGFQLTIVFLLFIFWSPELLAVNSRRRIQCRLSFFVSSQLLLLFSYICITVKRWWRWRWKWRLLQQKELWPSFTPNSNSKLCSQHPNYCPALDLHFILAPLITSFHWNFLSSLPLLISLATRPAAEPDQQL